MARMRRGSTSCGGPSPSAVLGFRGSAHTPGRGSSGATFTLPRDTRLQAVTVIPERDRSESSSVKRSSHTEDASLMCLCFAVPATWT